MISGLAVLKLCVALFAMLVLGVEVRNGRRGRDTHRLLFVCAALAAGAYFAPGLERGAFVHRWEMFHYYLGAKYAPELGYERLYSCVVTVDAGDEVRGARSRRVRDLRTDVLTSGERLLASSPPCAASFAPARFEAFRNDVRAFRRLSGGRSTWEAMGQDHGYNPPPLWTLVGGSLTRLGPPTPGLLAFLSCLDLGLMAGAVAWLVWGFGARVAMLAVIFWGTQAASDFGWTGGGFLRQDWLFLALAALALLRRGRPFWAGAALASAALLRLFPAALGVGLAVWMLRTLLVRRELGAEQRRLIAGALVGGSALVLATLLALGPGAYSAFWHHIQLRHFGIISNHMGLKTLFAFSPTASLDALVDRSLLDPTAPWIAARAARLASLAIAYRAAAFGVVALVGFVVWRARTAWLAMALSLPLIVALTEPSCYYYSVWVVALPLARARPAVGVTLLGVAAAGQLVGIRFASFDERYFALALLYVVSALVLLAAFTDSPLARYRRWQARRAGTRSLPAGGRSTTTMDFGST
jgi:hypothetical protein